MIKTFNLERWEVLKMESFNFYECLKGLLAEFILNCPDTCLNKQDNRVIITFPEDAFFEKVTNEIRTNIYNILANQDFIDKLKNGISLKIKEGWENSEISVLKDMSGYVIIIERT